MHEKTITSLNGTLLPAEEALLPVRDRGFRFGDGVFETIRLTHGVPYQWALHLARLQAGLERIEPYRSKASLLIGCPNDVAQGWLLPRLGDFLAQYPEVDVHRVLDDKELDLAQRLRRGLASQRDVDRSVLCDRDLLRRRRMSRHRCMIR